MLQLTDEELFRAVGWKLEGGPKETHRHFSEKMEGKGEKPKWSEFLEILKLRYTNTMRADQAREKLLSLKMSGKDIQKYNDEFDSLLSIIGYIKMSEEEMLAAYKHGISRNIYSELISKEANTMDMARKIAVSYCLRDDNNANNYVNYIGREINKPTTSSYNNRNDRINNNRPNSYKKNFTSNYKGIQNNDRQQPQYNNRQKPQQKSSYSRPTDYNKGKSNLNIECFHCKKLGHIKRNCQQIKNSNNTNVCNAFRVNMGNNTIPNSLVNVKGIPILAYFDTGAECSIMSASTAREYKFKIKPSSMKVRTASDEIVNPLGQTDLDVELGSVSVKISFIIMEHEYHPILLGMDWFSDARATIMPADNYITFNSRRVVMSNTSVIEYEDIAETDGDLYTDNGRPTQFSEFDETAESFGISPSQVNIVLVETKAILDGDQKETWEKEIIPVNKSSTNKQTNLQT